jgi:hypothetical protein
VKEKRKMNYIYDILLNFNKEFYSFYDWNKKDNIETIRKIPIFKTDTKTLLDFLNYEMKLEETFLDKIKNKTELFYRKKIKEKEYAFLITDTKKTIAIESKNNTIYVSDLLLDEEEITLEKATLLTLEKIPYQKTKPKEKQNLKTRKRKEIEEKIKLELLKIEQENLEKLKYIYFEYFNQESENIKEIRIKLEQEIEMNYTNFKNKMIPLLKLTKNIV